MDAKKELIIQDIKNIKFSKFTSFLEGLILVLKSHCVVQGDISEGQLVIFSR
jgi:hypothetical protein